MYLIPAFWPLCELFKYSLLKTSNGEFIPGLLLFVGQIEQIGTKRTFVQLLLANPCPVLRVLQGLFAQLQDMETDCTLESGSIMGSGLQKVSSHLRSDRSKLQF